MRLGMELKGLNFFIRGSQSANTVLQVHEKCLYAATTVFIFGVYKLPGYWLEVLCITAVQTVKYVVRIIMRNK